MTEKLKYKVGDKVLIEAEIEDVRHELAYPYILNATDGTPLTHVNENFFNKPCVRPLTKPKVTQELMNWYKNKYKESDSVWKVLDYFANEPLNEDSIAYWLYASNDKEQMQLQKERQHALATLIAYGPESVEVEKEKRYFVTLKSTNQVLFKDKDGYFFSSYHHDFGVNDTHMQQELIEAGFEGVFDNPMFEVEEVG